jgi:hypothetical protein
VRFGKEISPQPREPDRFKMCSVVDAADAVKKRRAMQCAPGERDERIDACQPRAEGIANVEFPIALLGTIERQFLIGLLKRSGRPVILPSKAARFA